MQRTKVGLALGSGAAKGFAHIGVLKAFSEHHIPVDAVAGSSMGSLVGALYAAGIPPTYMEALATELKWRHWADFTVPKMGLISGERVRELVALLTRDQGIEQLSMPLAIVATDLLRHECVTFRSGKIADAVRASISIPGVFVPCILDDTLYVDGGVLERVPVQAVYDLGATIVIAVDVSVSRTICKPESMVDVIIQSLDVMQEDMISKRGTEADFMILPDLGEIGPSHFYKAEKAIEAGYKAASYAIDAILELLNGTKSQVEEGCLDAISHKRSRQSTRGSSA